MLAIYVLNFGIKEEFLYIKDSITLVFYGWPTLARIQDIVDLTTELQYVIHEYKPIL